MLMQPVQCHANIHNTSIILSPSLAVKPNATRHPKYLTLSLLPPLAIRLLTHILHIRSISANILSQKKTGDSLSNMPINSAHLS